MSANISGKSFDEKKLKSRDITPLSNKEQFGRIFCPEYFILYSPLLLNFEQTSD